MRLLRRNTRTIYYSHYLGDERIEGSIEKVQTFSDPVAIDVTISGGSSSNNFTGNTLWVQEYFGLITKYSRIITVVGKSPFLEGDRVWVENDITEKNDYIVVRVNNGVSQSMIALQEVVDK